MKQLKIKTCKNAVKSINTFYYFSINPNLLAHIGRGGYGGVFIQPPSETEPNPPPS